MMVTHTGQLSNLVSIIFCSLALHKKEKNADIVKVLYYISL